MRILKAFLQMLALFPVFCLALLIVFLCICLFFLVVGWVFAVIILFGCGVLAGICLLLLFAILSLVELPFVLIFKKPIYTCQFGKRFFCFCYDLKGNASEFNEFVDEKILFRFLDFGESAFLFVVDIFDAMESWGGLFNAIGNALVWLNEVCEGTRKFKNAEQ